MSEPRVCCVVEDNNCERPPDGVWSGTRIRVCYQCGEDVCANCSKLAKNLHGRKARLCLNCIEENER